MITLSGAELRPGDKIYHPRTKKKKTDEQKWRHVYTVKEQPSVSPGAWSLRCKVVAESDGSKGVITVGPTELFHVERKEKKK